MLEEFKQITKKGQYETISMQIDRILLYLVEIRSYFRKNSLNDDQKKNYIVKIKAIEKFIDKTNILIDISKLTNEEKIEIKEQLQKIYDETLKLKYDYKNKTR